MEEYQSEPFYKIYKKSLVKKDAHYTYKTTWKHTFERYKCMQNMK